MVRTAATLLILAGLAPQLSAQGLKVHISADLEGITGVVTDEQLGPGGFEYARFREFMTDEVNAAIEGARAAGATEIVVADSHGNGQNILIERLPDDVLLVRSWPRPLAMMEGIDSTFDAAVFIGYHSSTTNTEGVRAHTMSSANLTAVRLNGVEMPEAGINAAIAGHFGVPVVAISGDDAIVAEAQGLLGDIEGATVKWALGFHSATTMMPRPAQQLIREKVEAGVRRHGSLRPYRLNGPIELEISFKHYRQAQVLAYLPFIELKDAHTIRMTAPDMVAVARFLEFISYYQPGLSP
ncbi:MAG: M55 family metallopeptidase [Gemmatimonadota bacterium]